MLVLHFLLPISYFVFIIECKLQPFIVGGETANIADFPYVAHLGIRCIDEKKEYMTSWICGSSIINQRIILTAAHCLYNCFEDTVITISVGHEYKIERGVTTAHSYIIHENYDDNTLSNDIALISVMHPLKFNESINRVALLKNPPYKEEALVAGWGETDESVEDNYEPSLLLRYTKQHVLDTKDCIDLLKWIPKGTFCAQNRDKKGYTSRGDSGSALVVDGYIQLGIVSGKNPEANTKVTVYTDIGYFYEWLLNSTGKIICHE